MVNCLHMVAKGPSSQCLWAAYGSDRPLQQSLLSENRSFRPRPLVPPLASPALWKLKGEFSRIAIIGLSVGVPSAGPETVDCGCWSGQTRLGEA
jgi:hypothetical protein